MHRCQEFIAVPQSEENLWLCVTHCFLSVPVTLWVKSELLSLVSFKGWLPKFRNQRAVFSLSPPWHHAKQIVFKSVFFIWMTLTFSPPQVGSPRVPLPCQPEGRTSVSPPPRRQTSSPPVRSCAARGCSAAWRAAWPAVPSATAATAPPPTRSWRRLWGPMIEVLGLRGPSGVCFLPVCPMIHSSGSTAAPRTQPGSPDPPRGSTPIRFPRSQSPRCLGPGVFWPRLCPQPCP